MTIKNGKSLASLDVGGGISNKGRLTVKDCIITRTLLYRMARREQPGNLYDE